MFRLALRMLMGDRAKYIMLVGGLTFSALLMTQQNAVFQGLLSWTTSHMRNMRSKIWVVEGHVDQVNETKALRDTDVNRVRSATGVEYAEPLFQGIVKGRAADGSDKQIQLIGLDAGTLMGRPPVMLEGGDEGLAKLRIANNVVIDDLAAVRLAVGGKTHLTIGDTFEINDREARVVGVCKTERHFFGYPYVFCSYDQALQYAPRQRKMLSMILAEPSPGLSAELVASNIMSETGLRAYTVPQFEKSTFAWIWKNTGIPASFMTTIALGFFVGVAVAGQTFYSFVLENLRNLGALKAMGASNGLLASMLLLQAFTVGLIGYGIGLGLTAIFGFVVMPIGQPPFLLTPESMVRTLISILVICTLAALFGIRRVAKLEPAVVFRG
ncbi:MAG TPA: ABC transporter permease [Candidatus Limnocylindria bacterium]|nr:ABC transporter permease [Candidatus Limnocylindria bacterium]